MKKFLKWLAFTVLGVVVSLAIVMVIMQQRKPEILAVINEKLNEWVEGDVRIGNYNITFFHNFPNLSITLKNIHLKGPSFEKYQQEFLRAQRVDINVQPLKLFQKVISIKSIDIENGEVFVFKTKTGYTNLDVFKEKKSDTLTVSTPRSILIDLKEINLKNVQITYQDSLKEKSFGVRFTDTKNSIISNDSSYLIHLGGKMKFDGLMLNSEKGSFLRNKSVVADLNLILDSAKQDLHISPSSLIFDKSTVNVSGAFHFVDQRRFQLDIQSEKLNYQEGLTIVSDTLAKKLGVYGIEKPIDLRVLIEGPMQPGILPAVDITFSFEDSKVSAGKIDMDKMSITGTFTNHVDSTLRYNDRNSQLHFASMKGLMDKIPVEAVATLTDLVNPILKLNATFNVDLKQMNQHIDTDKIKLTSGHFVSQFSYRGTLMEYLDDTKNKYDGKLTGTAKITNGKIQYPSKKITLDKINATFAFTEKKFEIRKLALRLNNNDINVKGFFTHFVPFFTNPEKVGKANLTIISPQMDISTLVQVRKKEKTKISKAASKKKLDNLVEKFNDKLEFDLDFNVSELLNGNFKASNVKGRLILANNEFIIKNAMMNFASGKVKLNMGITDLQKAINPLSIDAILQDVEIKEFFYAFNNFNQTTFHHSHIDGKLSLNAILRAEINEDLRVLTPRLNGEATFTIKDGRLRGFEPMERLSNFLFKERDFSDVQFGDINSSVSMTGTMMNINRMEVESTVITMFIEGRYDLLDSTDLSIQVPLSNLKKRSQDIPPENVGVDAKAGPSVFLRVRPDKDGKTAITYDPFKKFRKNKRTSKVR